MTIWYRTGSVTVTSGSKNVVGVDTTFNTSIYPGDLFTVDESTFYEVDTITDNLNFTLQKNYAGTTGSGKAYVVVPLSPKRQLTAELAARVNTLIERYRGAIEAWTAGGWAVDTNGDYKVSGDTDRKLVPIENGGGGLGTATKRWGQVHANSVTIAGQAVVPTTTPTASSIPIADSGGKIADGWIKDATASVKGVVELATNAETTAGTDATRAVTPAGVAAALAKGVTVLTATDLNSEDYLRHGAWLTASSNLTNVPSGYPSNIRYMMETLYTDSYNIQTIFALQVLHYGKCATRVIIGGPGSRIFGPWQIIYNSENLLGTVSQVGGVPTGAIIERGSNSNGEYVKFADGTMICTVHKSWVGDETYHPTGTLPASYINTAGFPINAVRTYAIAADGILFASCFANSHSTYLYWVQQITQNVLSKRTGNSTVTSIFIGRWF